MNQSPGFACTCMPEYFGDNCETSYDDCVDDFTKCVNGICIDQDRTEIGVSNFTCFCNNGWEIDEIANVCNRDINECLSSPCYIGVQCVNTPGSFYCGSCPTGYQVRT